MAKKVTALTKITTEAKRLRKGNNMEWTTAVKKASKLYNAGALGAVAKVAGKKKPAKKKAIAKKPYATMRYKTTGGGNATESVYKSKTGRTNVKTIVTKRVSGVDKALMMEREIDRLEKKRSLQPTKAKKDTVQVFINAKHKELNSYLKSKQA